MTVKNHGKTLVLLTIKLSLFLILCFIVVLMKWAEKDIALPNEGVQVRLLKGEGLQDFSRKLKSYGLISNPLLFELWVRSHPESYKRFQAGNYLFEDSINPKDLIKNIIEGNTHNILMFEFTIPEGSTYKNISNDLVSSGIGSDEEFEKLFENTAWHKDMKIPCLEGFLYPATYTFYNERPSPQTIVEETIEEFFRRLPENYEKDLQKHSLTLKEWVTFASLIERETHLKEEKTMVAEVISRRLKYGITLGIDAALIYGIKDFSGNIRSRDLRNPQNLYNTRIYKGLPPTPIGSPSLSSLLAVFNPTKEGYLYFVRRPDRSMSHHFSKTLKEHNIHVRKWVRYQKQRKK